MTAEEIQIGKWYTYRNSAVSCIVYIREVDRDMCYVDIIDYINEYNMSIKPITPNWWHIGIGEWEETNYVPSPSPQSIYDILEDILNVK